jgi:hypothetical protein
MLPTLLSLVLAAPPAPPFEVTSAVPLPELTKRFERTTGWTGGDGAYSVPLGRDRTLWLFGDTWVGKVKDGRRVGARMINNSVAWQSLTDARAPLRFFWDDGKAPAALLRPTRPGAWYWPGDGALVGDKLYLFCKVLRRKKGAPGFEFDWFANELLCIANPRAEPPAWKVERRALPNEAGSPRLGVGCRFEGDHLYAYGLFPARDCKPLDVPLAVARIHRRDLATLDMKGWRYWCATPDGPRWTERSTNLVPLFRDAAPEMSVSRARGIDGFVAVYTSIGLSADIMVRQAPRPEGPWSAPLRVYRCPEVGRKLLLYGAKAHPELATRDGELILTYCRNIGDLAEHVRQPNIYVPQGVKVQLRPKRSP